MTRRSMLVKLAQAGVATLAARLLGACSAAEGEMTGPIADPSVRAARFVGEKRLGLVAHHLGRDNALAVRAIGLAGTRVTHYAGHPMAEIDAAITQATVRLGHLPLVVIHGGTPARWQVDMVAIASRHPGLAYQLGNEVDTESFGSHFAGTDGPQQYAEFAIRTRQFLWGTDPTARLVSSGLGGEKPGAYLAAMGRAVKLTQAFDAVAVHCYGPPISTAIEDRVREVRAALEGAKAPLPIWVTEFGIAAKDAERAWRTPAEDFPRLQASQWLDAIAALDRMNVAQAYGYAIDGVDGYAIEDATLAALRGLVDSRHWRAA